MQPAADTDFIILYHSPAVFRNCGTKRDDGKRYFCSNHREYQSSAAWRLQQPIFMLCRSQKDRLACRMAELHGCGQSAMMPTIVLVFLISKCLTNPFFFLSLERSRLFCARPHPKMPGLFFHGILHISSHGRVLLPISVISELTTNIHACHHQFL